MVAQAAALAGVSEPLNESPSEKEGKFGFGLRSG